MYNTHVINKRILTILESLHLKIVHLKFFARKKSNQKGEFQLFIYSSVLLKIEGNSITLQVTQDEHIDLSEYEIFRDCFITYAQGECVYKFTAQLIDFYNVSNKDFIIFSSVTEAEEYCEQRRFPRAIIRTPLTYWIDLPAYCNKISSGTLIDISEGGVQFSTGLRLNDNIPVGINFTLPTLGQIAPKGIVRWCAETTNANYYGIEFTQITQDDKGKVRMLVNNILRTLV